MRGFFAVFLCRRTLLCMHAPAKMVEIARLGRAAFWYSNVLFAPAIHSALPVNISLCSRHLSSTVGSGSSLWEGSSYEILLRKLQLALHENSMVEAWEAFSNVRRLHGLPKQQHLVSKVILLLSYSSSSNWLHKAYDLAISVLRENPSLLSCECLSGLSLTLARAQLAMPASTILRIMLEKHKFPRVEIWSTLFLHLVKTQVGSYLATQILIEICEYFDARNSSEINLKKPTVTMFNLVLDASTRFRSTLKAKQIIELMPKVGVVADVNTVNIIAKIYEMNGELDDLKNLKEHIFSFSSMTLHHHYQQFYDSLLSLYFKYNDLDAAAELILDLYRCTKNCHQSSNGSFSKGRVFGKEIFFQIGSSNLKTGCKIVVDPKSFEVDFIVGAQHSPRFVHTIEGKLIPSKKALAKLVNGYVKEGKVGKLSSLLINVHREMDHEEGSLSRDVLNACIMLGWLDTAHDILDDLQLANIPVEGNLYLLLLRAYCKQGMMEEAKVLLKQTREAGYMNNIPDELDQFTGAEAYAALGALDKSEATLYGNSDIFKFLDIESREYISGSQVLYELNASIMFFCRANMMEDALNTLKQMRKRNISPTFLTFSYLVNGYSTLGMFREITILWGEVRRMVEDGTLEVDRDLFDCLLWNFVRGGYFERIMEIINYMLKHKMYIDKWKYRREFMKFHKNLYPRLKASDCRTDAQSKRLEYVQAFRSWVGINK